MRMTIKVTTLLLLVLLMGCGFIEDMREMSKKMETVKQDFEQQTGLKPDIGWNITNGQLTDLNIVFSIDDVRDRTVSELEEASLPIIMKHFDQLPSVLNITIASRSSRK